MPRQLPSTLLTLCLATAHVAAYIPKLDLLPSLDLHSKRAENHLQARDTDPNGSTFLWLIEDVYNGTTFFDTWDFWTAADPTNGKVNYLSRNDSFAKNLTYFVNNGEKVIMKGDDYTYLDYGANRNSVRITSQKLYNSGSLFILDIDRAPWGCAVWPAWWTVGSNWPWQGEIDIIEGVHDNEHNQVTWHTADGCWFTPSKNYTGGLINTANTTCYAEVNNNAGCAVLEWSRASYGPLFDQQGGGVFAMKWDEVSISVWSFYRSAVPADVTDGNPNPSLWGPPVAMLSPQGCDLTKYFYNHSIVFDITFCGDWAGNSYPSWCPGTCTDRLMDPTNFVNASWIINSLKVYQKHLLSAPVKQGGASALASQTSVWAASSLAMGAALALVL